MVHRKSGPSKIMKRPVMFLRHGIPEMAFSRGALMKSPKNNRSDDLPRISKRQWRALNAVHFYGNDNALRMRYETGDVIFFNNRRILHGRTAFEDDRDVNKPRHILRLWLKDAELAGEPPACLQDRWHRIFDKRADGGDEEYKWPPTPAP